MTFLSLIDLRRHTTLYFSWINDLERHMYHDSDKTLYKVGPTILRVSSKSQIEAFF